MVHDHLDLALCAQDGCHVEGLQPKPRESFGQERPKLALCALGVRGLYRLQRCKGLSREGQRGAKGSGCELTASASAVIVVPSAPCAMPSTVVAACKSAWPVQRICRDDAGRAECKENTCFQRMSGREASAERMNTFCL